MGQLSPAENQTTSPSENADTEMTQGSAFPLEKGIEEIPKRTRSKSQTFENLTYLSYCEDDQLGKQLKEWVLRCRLT